MNEQLKIVISADVSELKKAVQDAQSEVKSFSQKIKDSMGNVDGIMKGVGDKIKSGIKTGMDAAVNAVKTGAKAMAAGLASVSAAVIGTVEGTEEYRENMAKLTTAFEQAGSSAEVAKETYTDLYKVMGDNGAATEAAQQLSQLTTDEQALAQWTEICTGVYAEMGSTLPIEGLAEAANETAKVGQVTGSLADALNWAGLENETFGVSLKENIKFTELSKKEYDKLTDSQKAQYDAQKAQYDAINDWNKSVEEAISAEDRFNLALQECNSEAEREELIRKTLLGVYSDSAAAYEENNKKILEQREAQAKLQETLAAIGDALQPVVTLFTSLAAEALALVQPYIEELAAKIPGLVEQFKAWATDALPGVKDALAKVAETLGKVISAIVNNWGTIVAIAGVIGGITAAIGLYNAVAAVKAAMAAAEVTTIWGLVAAYAAQAVAVAAAMAPYLLIVAAIAAVIAIIVLCVKHWDKITEAVGNFFSAAGEWLSSLGESISEWWTSVTEGFSEWWNGLVEGFTEFFANIWEGISAWWSDLTTGFSEFFSGIWDAISEWWNNLVQGFADFFSNIWSSITEWWGNLKQGWQESWDNTKSKVSEGVENVKTKFSDMKDKASETFNRFKENAKNKFEEIKNNIKDKTENAKQIVSEKYNQVKENMTNAMENAKNNIKNKLDNIKSAYESNGGGIKGVVAGYMEAVRGTFDSVLTTIDKLTGGKFSNILGTVREKMNGAFSAAGDILNKISSKFTEIWDKCKTTVSNAIDKIKGFFNFSWSLPKIKMPHFSISGSFSLNPPSVPHISVSWYKFGGIFDNPTLFPYGNGQIGGLGEDGAEAIVPLEKNTQWLDRIATMLNEKQGGSRPIVLQVDGKTFAQISVDSINDLTRQTGSLPLKLA